MSEASRASGRQPHPGRVGTVVNGKWTIDARIGSGGMATVYAATHRNGHRAALKMLHTQLSRDESTRVRFLREGYVANAVGHAGVAHVEDDGVTEDGSAFLVLELLQGETLEARRMRLGGTMPVDELLDFADAALDVLAAAHEKGIVHRDVKPDNVFITWDSQVKLLDFGLARMKHMQGEVTKTGVTIGTPEFMAPEQAQGRRDDVDARSDIWAIGATLFTSLTGKYVHEAINLQQQLIASATVRPRSVRALAPHVSLSLAIVIDRALELDQKDRWESAREMQRALRAARAARPTNQPAPDSLTLPAASPASLRRGPAAIPESGSRPSTGRSLGLPLSEPTLQFRAPLSDPTIEESAPLTIHLDELPTSGVPPVPTTERLTGTPSRKSGAELQALSKYTQAIEEALAQNQLPPTRELGAASRPVVRGRHDSTLPSPGGPGYGPGPQPQPPSAAPANAGGSGPHAAQSSGAHPALRSSHPRQRVISTNAPHPSSVEPPTGPEAYRSRPTEPPAPPQAFLASQMPGQHPLAAPIGPVSLRARRSSRRVVLVSLLLILACAGAAAWVYLRPMLAHR